MVADWPPVTVSNNDFYCLGIGIQYFCVIRLQMCHRLGPYSARPITDPGTKTQEQRRESCQLEMCYGETWNTDNLQQTADPWYDN